MKNFKHLFFVLYFIGIHFVFQAQNLPKELLKTYETEPLEKYSDEFNGKRKKNSFDTKKWHYRQPKPWRKGLATGSKYVQEKDGKLICHGRKDDHKAGGIVSNKYFQYGFYAFKWKTTGIADDQRNAWHPSVWGSLNDTHNKKVPGTYEKGKSWMEIDIMEFSTWKQNGTDWNADAPAYIWVDSLQKKVKVNQPKGKAFGWKKAMMTDGKKDTYKDVVIGSTGFDKWQTLGMEYHPDYLQLWQIDGDTWVKIGHKVTFTENDVPPSLRTVPKKAVKPLYWYIGNLFMPHGKTKITEEQITNSTLELDWFHYHSLKK